MVDKQKASVVIKTNRMIFRSWRDEDLVHFARINGDPLVMEYYPGRLDEKASAHLMTHFQEHIDRYGYGFFAVENRDTGEFMGFAGLAQVSKDLPFAPAVEMAWRFDYPFWGKGYATEAAQALMTQAFDVLGLKEIVAFCVVEHERAVAVLESLGFKTKSKENFMYAPQRQSKNKREYKLYRLKKSG